MGGGTTQRHNKVAGQRDPASDDGKLVLAEGIDHIQPVLLLDDEPGGETTAQFDALIEVDINPLACGNRD